jgi:fatty-acid desaturase
VKLRRDNIIAFVVIHLIAALALLPWFFSRTGVVLLFTGIYVFGMLGINLGFHRLLTHRGFTCPLWLERALVLLGTCSVQDSPPHWVAAHRKHHQYADDEKDPHSPIAGFFWAHMGWLLARVEDMKRGPLIDRYARDVMRDPLYAWIERRKNWMKIALISWILYFVAGFAAALLMGETAERAVQFGLSLFVWGGVLRTVVVWHLTWSVNSVSHVWGYRNYDTPDVSRNNALIGYFVAGEGWHNNHHADPTSARHGHQWWEFDLTWMMIRFLMLVGLAKNVALPSPALAMKYKSRAAPGDALKAVPGTD